MRLGNLVAGTGWAVQGLAGRGGDLGGSSPFPQSFSPLTVVY